MFLKQALDNYPNLLSNIYFLNAPLSFETDVLDDLKEDLPDGTVEKIRLSPSHTHPDLDEATMAKVWNDFEQKT